MDLDEKYLSLLKYSLERKNVSERKYHIGSIGDEKKVNDALCLLKDDKQWLVAYSERGLITEKSSHSSLRVAIKDFYARLAVDENPWSFRREWERDAGDSF